MLKITYIYITCSSRFCFIVAVIMATQSIPGCRNHVTIAKNILPCNPKYFRLMRADQQAYAINWRQNNVFRQSCTPYNFVGATIVSVQAQSQKKLVLTHAKTTATQFVSEHACFAALEIRSYCLFHFLAGPLVVVFCNCINQHAVNSAMH